MSTSLEKHKLLDMVIMRLCICSHRGRTYLFETVSHMFHIYFTTYHIFHACFTFGLTF